MRHFAALCKIQPTRGVTPVSATCTGVVFVCWPDLGCSCLNPCAWAGRELARVRVCMGLPSQVRYAIRRRGHAFPRASVTLHTLTTTISHGLCAPSVHAAIVFLFCTWVAHKGLAALHTHLKQPRCLTCLSGSCALLRVRASADGPQRSALDYGACAAGDAGSCARDSAGSSCPICAIGVL